jgi:phosphoribosylglycinamide formyltransferase-1
MVKKNACIFISGTGTNLNALVKNSRITVFPINIKLVVSNKKNARGLLLAKKYSIPYRIIDTKDSLFEIKILNEIKQKKISIICLAGYMKVLSKNFIKNFKGKILNIHPSLLPKYKGLNTFSKILQNQEILSGCTVHYVNEKLDSGSIILQKKVLINKLDTETSLKKKVLKQELKLYPEAIRLIFK